MLEALQLPFVQRGLAEVLILSVPAGILGSWIVLRGLAFFSHAVGTAAFPGLVVTGSAGVSPPVGALGAAALFGATTGGLERRGRLGNDAVTAVVLTGFLAAGVILASDVFSSDPGTDQMLFGSLFLVTTTEIAISVLAAAAAVIANAVLGARWLASGFDPNRSITAGAGSAGLQAVLLVLVALTAAAVVPVVGALLVGALLVLPAATARLLTGRMASWQLLAVGLTALEGCAGVVLSVHLDLPPGPLIAVLAAAVFALAAAARSLK